MSDYFTYIMNLCEDYFTFNIILDYKRFYQVYNSCFYIRNPLSSNHNLHRYDVVP